MMTLGARDPPRIEGDERILPLCTAALEMMGGGTRYKHLYAYPSSPEEGFKEDFLFLSPIPLNENIATVNLFLKDKAASCHPIMKLLSGEKKGDEFKANILKIDVRSLKAAAHLSLILDLSQEEREKLTKIQEELENNKEEYNINHINYIRAFSDILPKTPKGSYIIDFNNEKIVKLSPNRPDVIVPSDLLCFLRHGRTEEKNFFISYFGDFPIIIISFFNIQKKFFRMTVDIDDVPGSFLKYSQIIEKYASLIGLSSTSSLETKIGSEGKKEFFTKGYCNGYYMLTESELFNRLKKELADSDVKKNIINGPTPIKWVPDEKDIVLTYLDEELNAKWESIEESPQGYEEYDREKNTVYLTFLMNKFKVDDNPLVASLFILIKISLENDEKDLVAFFPLPSGSPVPTEHIETIYYYNLPKEHDTEILSIVSNKIKDKYKKRKIESENVSLE